MGLPGCVLATILASSSLDDQLCDIQVLDSPTIGISESSQTTLLEDYFIKNEYEPFRILDEGVRWRAGEFELEFNYGRMNSESQIRGLDNYRNTHFEQKNPKGIYLQLKKQF